MQSNNSVIKNYMEQLTPDTGFKSIWIDFIENQKSINEQKQIQ